MYASVAIGRTPSGSRLTIALIPEKTAPSRCPAALRAVLKTPGVHWSLGDFQPASRTQALLGVGARNNINAERLRLVGRQLVEHANRLGASRVELVLDALGEKLADSHDTGRAIGEGLAIGSFRFQDFDGSATKHVPQRGKLTVTARNKNIAAGLRQGVQLGGAVNAARRLAATPPNICTPAFVAKCARSLARKHAGLTCTVLSHDKVRKLGMGGIDSVGMGSASKPCLILLEWKPTRAKSNEKLALVGKTVTFDTGGYSLKPGAGMRGMKYDKNGGMAVLGAMQAIAEAKLPVRVVAALPAAENMVSSNATRPDDIITMHNGVTVEVTNTDAEGRLVLGDALSYVCAKYKPTAVVDVATLTGGVVVALGKFCAGFFCENAQLTARISRAAASADERVWRLPLWDDHREFMRSQHADILNSNAKREAHPIQGAAFLSYFVPKDVPWAHIDIAGVSVNTKPSNLAGRGPSGFGVRLLFDWVSGYVS